MTIDHYKLDIKNLNTRYATLPTSRSATRIMLRDGLKNG